MLIGCRNQESAQPGSISAERQVESPVARRQDPASDPDENAPLAISSQMHFQNVADEAGIDFRFFADIVPGRYFLPEIMGGGVGWIDFDVDGRLDLYVANGRPLVVTPEDAARAATIPRQGNRLYRQTSDAHFTELAGHAAADVEAYSQGITVGDYDADGFKDVYVSSYGNDVLLSNNGDGTFTDVTITAGTTDPLWSTSGVWCDFSGDGLLDLYVVNYMKVTPETQKICQQEGKPKYCGPGDYEGVPDSVYVNRGDGTFATATDDLGFSLSEGRSGLGVLAADFDEDLAAEVYVANDMEPNLLFTKASPSEPRRYKEVAADSGCAVGGDGMNEASMGLACGDLDGDGRPDLYLTHYYHTKNTLYRNLGGLLFDDQSRRSGIAAATHERTGFGTIAADFDRDGDLDLFAANGHVLGPENPPFEMKPGLLQNNDGRYFDRSSLAGSYFETTMLGRGAASADFDNDGDIDLAVSHIDQPLALLANVSKPGGSFIGFDLRSTDRLPPVGGRVRVEAGGRTWVVPVTAGGSYLSSNDRRLFVGLGSADDPVRVEVFWPSGNVSRYDGLDANGYWRIYESGRKPEKQRVSASRGESNEA